MFQERVDWGICENCGKFDCLLVVFVHHPTDVQVWVCSDCAQEFDKALQQNQVPGILGEKIQKAIKG